MASLTGVGVPRGTAMGILRQARRERGHSIRWYQTWLLVTAMSTGALAAGCSSESAVTTGPTQLKCQVTLATPSSSFGPDGGTGLVTVATTPECPWEVSSGADWLSELSPTSGQGNGTVEFHAARNPQAAVREGEVVVNESRLRVTQQGAACRFELRSGSFAIDAGGGSREMAVAAPSGCSWTVATDANWITITPATGSGDGSVSVTVAPNRGDERRQGTIAVGDQRLTVTQESPACAFEISSSSSAVLPSGGGDVSASVTTASGCAWTAGSSVSWMTVVAGASGSGNGSVAFRVAPNSGGVRTGTVTVAGQTFTITQAAAGSPNPTPTPPPTPTPNPSPTPTPPPAPAPPTCSYTINPSSLTVPAKGGEGSTAVSAGAGCAWTARSEDGWIKVSSGTSGNGNGAVTFVVEEHKGKGDRTGTLTIAGRTFTVRQQGKD